MAKILVVEDSAVWQTILQRPLQIPANEVVPADRLDRALSIIDKELKFDVVIIDLKLDEKEEVRNIFQSLQIITSALKAKSEFPIPTIIVTATEATETQLLDLVNHFGGWIYGYFIKDFFDPVEYSETVQKAFAYSEKQGKLAQTKPEDARSHAESGAGSDLENDAVSTDLRLRQALWQFFRALVGFTLIVFIILTIVALLIPTNLAGVVIVAGIALVILLITSLGLFINKLTGQQFVEIMKEILKHK